MTCKHTKSLVYDSREEGHTNAAARPYRYLQSRRRECLDCGHRFRTFELTEEQLTAYTRQTLGDALAHLRRAMDTITGGGE
jgi:transcriptional regulator NrdR family protein